MLLWDCILESTVKLIQLLLSVNIKSRLSDSCFCIYIVTPNGYCQCATWGEICTVQITVAFHTRQFYIHYIVKVEWQNASFGT